MRSYYYTAGKSKNKNAYDNEGQAVISAAGINGIQKTFPVISCNAVNNPIGSIISIFQTKKLRQKGRFNNLPKSHS